MDCEYANVIDIEKDWGNWPTCIGRCASHESCWRAHCGSCGRLADGHSREWEWCCG